MNRHQELCTWMEMIVRHEDTVNKQEIKFVMGLIDDIMLETKTTTEAYLRSMQKKKDILAKRLIA
jgi:hypothetical protein